MKWNHNDFVLFEFAEVINLKETKKFESTFKLLRNRFFLSKKRSKKVINKNDKFYIHTYILREK